METGLGVASGGAEVVFLMLLLELMLMLMLIDIDTKVAGRRRS